MGVGGGVAWGVQQVGLRPGRMPSTIPAAQPVARTGGGSAWATATTSAAGAGRGRLASSAASRQLGWPAWPGQATSPVSHRHVGGKQRLAAVVHQHRVYYHGQRIGGQPFGHRLNEGNLSQKTCSPWPRLNR